MIERHRLRTASLVAVASAATLACAGVAVEPSSAPRFTEDGTVEVPAFELPPSDFMSEEAAAQLAMRSRIAGRAPSPENADIAAVRAGLEKQLAPQVARMRELYPVDVEERTIANVRTRVVTPRGRPHDPDRVLVNLHGGAFSLCADACSMLESVPMASVGGFEVVSVDYRMAPEAEHPAALEDVAAVYRELLETHDASRIGIYGCSAGGALSAQAGAWLPEQGLPQAGAIGILGAGGVRFGAGDSATIAGYIDGSFPPPPREGDPPRRRIDRGYFANADRESPVVSPALHLDVLRAFPPTILVTGTRAMDMSPAIYTNSQLIKAGV